jgi:hypothetical protein
MILFFKLDKLVFLLKKSYILIINVENFFDSLLMFKLCIGLLL